MWNGSGELDSVGRVAATEIVEGSPPASGRVLVDEVGLVWLREFGNRVGGAEKSPSSYRWWIIDTDHGALGHVDLPPSIDPIHTGTDEVLARSTDAFGVPYLEVWECETDGKTPHTLPLTSRSWPDANSCRHWPRKRKGRRFHFGSAAPSGRLAQPALACESTRSRTANRRRRPGTASRPAACRVPVAGHRRGRRTPNRA